MENGGFKTLWLVFIYKHKESLVFSGLTKVDTLSRTPWIFDYYFQMVQAAQNANMKSSKETYCINPNHIFHYKL